MSLGVLLMAMIVPFPACGVKIPPPTQQFRDKRSVARFGVIDRALYARGWRIESGEGAGLGVNSPCTAAFPRTTADRCATRRVTRGDSSDHGRTGYEDQGDLATDAASGA